ncbi:MAG: sialidase family protein [Acidimicrobiales bacterium]|nr:sialidase family protein [Acidimicrobiales bacterium]
MFEHLDDPSPPEPSARTLGAVLARAARLRRRRAASALGAVAVGALSLGVVIGVVASGPAAPQTFAAFDSQTGLLAPGTPVPSTDLESVVFVGQQRGFALVVHSTQSLLAVSTDGGESWAVADPSLPVSFPAQFEFSDADHGYLWGGPPSPSGTVALWVTSDAGRTWRRAGIGPVVSDVSAIGPDVWAVVGTCPISSSAGPSCPVSVEVSTDDGQTWARAGTAPPLSENPQVSVSDQNIELARITRTRAYVLSFASRAGAPDTAGYLTYTADAGRSWTSRRDPCPSYFDFGEQIAASGTEDLWMVCASQASAGSQAKALFRSSDGGVQWGLAAAANAAVLTGGRVLPSAGGLPVSGYVTPYSLGHENLAVLTAGDAWLFPDRSGVFQTTDGGRTWGVVAGLAKAGFVGGGSGNVVFVDATHGWVCEAGSGLWRTSDGRDWQHLGQ